MQTFHLLIAIIHLDARITRYELTRQHRMPLVEGKKINERRKDKVCK